MPQTTEFRLGVDGVASFEFDDGSTKTVDLGNISGGGAGTNLTISQNTTTVTVNSDTGTDAIIPAATSTNAGVMSAAQVTSLSNKADKLSTIVVSDAGNFDLTEALHNGRRVVAAVSGVVFTKNTTWSSDAIGVFLDVDADGTFTLGTGITIPSGCASSSATAAGGAVDMTCVDGVLSSKTPALASATSSGVAVYKITPVSDVASVSSVETIVWEGLLSGLVQGSEVDVPFRLGGTGTGAKNMRIRVGGTAGTADGTVVHEAFSNNATWRQIMGFAIGIGGASVVGTSGAIVSYGYVPASAHPTASITAGADLRVKVTLQKATAADVVNVQSGQVRVYA